MTTEGKALSAERPVALVVADFMFAARVQNALAEAGWASKTESAPESALETYKSFPPDLVLVELGAGNPARLQLIRDLRSAPGGAKTPLLAFGSHKAKAMLEEARVAGATMVVSNRTLVSRFRDVVKKAVSPDLKEEERMLTEDDE